MCFNARKQLQVEKTEFGKVLNKRFKTTLLRNCAGALKLVLLLCQLLEITAELSFETNGS